MSSRWKRLGLAAIAGPFLLLSGGMVAASMGASCTSAATEGRRVSFTTRVVAEDAVDAPIVNAYGWSIVLSRAALSIGPLYYWSGAPALAATNHFLRALGLREAHAHPGHYVPGDAMGQVLASSSVDLALGEAALPPGEGVSGVYRSARFSFAEKPTGSEAGALGAHVVVLEGEASKETMKRLFRAELDIADVLDAEGEPNVEGCLFEGEPDIQADGTVTIRVAPSVWLDQLELDAVPENLDGKPILLARDSIAFRAIARGIKKAPAISFHYSTP